MAQSAVTEVPNASPIPSWLPRALMYGALAAVALLGVRFFVSDAVPYYTDITADQYGRYWGMRPWFLGHILGGTLALSMGPFQFWSGLKRRSLHVHKWTGRLYVGGIALGATASVYLALTSPSSTDWTVGLLALAAAWVGTTSMAFYAIKRRKITFHKEWMIRSYVVTFAFVTFRWWSDIPAIRDYLGDSRPITLMWACWAIPLLVTEMVIQMRAMGRGRAKA